MGDPKRAAPGGKMDYGGQNEIRPPTVQFNYSAYKTITQFKNHNYL